MRAEVLDRIKQSKPPQVYLANLRITDDEIPEIMQKIKALQPNMTWIIFDSNQLSDKGAKALTGFLREFRQLGKISIQHNNIGEEGALALFGLKKDINSLVIHFHGNKISDMGEMIAIERRAIQQESESSFSPK